MSLIMPVKDGEIQYPESTEKTERAGGSLDKDAFLQLLVAQMKYQDPLEPTSNTEYISQLATFSSLEEMQNMSSTLNLQRASALVGQEVYIETKDATGNTVSLHGLVDYVTYENSKAFVAVNGETYPLDDVVGVYNPDYTDAIDLAYEWTVGLNHLPALSKLTLGDEEAVMELKDVFDSMSDYQKGFITQENQEKLQSYVDRINVLKKAAQELEGKVEGNGGAADSEDTDGSEETGNATSSDQAQSAGNATGSDTAQGAGSAADSGKTQEAGGAAGSEQVQGAGGAQDSGTAQETDSAADVEAQETAASGSAQGAEETKEADSEGAGGDEAETP